MLMPFDVADYVDFYASEHHATNLQPFPSSALLTVVYRKPEIFQFRPSYRSQCQNNLKSL
jgi:hypothetical protein